MIRGIRPPQNPEGVAVFLDCGFKRDGAMYTLVMHRLAEKGWLPVSLHPDLDMPRHPDPVLGGLNGMLVREGPTRYRLAGTAPEVELAHNWEIDLNGQICRAEGINFFDVVRGKLRRYFKTYELDFERPDIKIACRDMIASADAALSICRYLRDHVAARNLPVRILGCEHLYVPSGIFNIYCAERGREFGIEFVDFSGAYSHYFTAGEYLKRHSFAVRNVTRHDTISRHIVDRDAFDEWLKHNGGGDAAREAKAAALSIVANSWTGKRDIPPDAVGMLDRIAAHRENGGIVACLYGHVGFDLGVPRDCGDGHADMVDWMNDTIETLNGKDVLLLIKPHPTEKRYKPNRKPNQMLADLIHVPLADNVVLMDALWLGTHEIMDHIDIGLIWRSNAALELAIKGIPAIVAGREAAYRNAVDLIYPESQAHYHELLDNLENIGPMPGQGERAALLLRYIAEETFINLPYVRQPALKSQDGFRYANPGLAWDEAKLADFLANGDPNIDRICTEIVN